MCREVESQSVNLSVPTNREPYIAQCQLPQWQLLASDLAEYRGVAPAYQPPKQLRKRGLGDKLLMQQEQYNFPLQEGLSSCQRQPIQKLGLENFSKRAHKSVSTSVWKFSSSNSRCLFISDSGVSFVSNNRS